jgi:hypothetical protein
MPGFLLNAGTTVLCVHGGQAKPTLPNPRVRVMGLPVVTQGPPYIVAGCTNVPPPPGRIPCVSATWVVAALRVKVMGLPVLLQDSQAVCIPTGTPVTIIPSQFRVRGM